MTSPTPAVRPAPSARPAGGARLARRAAATFVDYAVIAAPLALAGVLRRTRSVAAPPASGAQRAAGAVPPRVLVALALTVPISCLLAAAEARGGSPGKRLLRLRVRARDGTPPSYATALARAVLKTAIPWEIGHQAVWDLRGTQARRGACLALLAHAALAAQAAMVWTGEGRTYADLLAGTVVVDAAHGDGVPSRGWAE